MKTRVRFAAIVAVLALLIGFLAERELTRGLSFDALLTLRHAVFGDRHQGQVSDVVVVNIDEDTFDAQGFVTSHSRCGRLNSHRSWMLSTPLAPRSLESISSLRRRRKQSFGVMTGLCSPR